jgi:hypothetical protein
MSQKYFCKGGLLGHLSSGPDGPPPPNRFGKVVYE